MLPSVEEVGASFAWEPEELDTLLAGSPLRNMRGPRSFERAFAFAHVRSFYLKDQVRGEFEKLQERLSRATKSYL